MKRLTKKQQQQRQEFVTHSIGMLYKPKVQTTEFERLLKRLNLVESECHLNAEMRAWCKANRNRRCIPEGVLLRLRMKTRYDDEPSAFSLVAGTVIPDATPLQELELQHDHQTQ